MRTSDLLIVAWVSDLVEPEADLVLLPVEERARRGVRRVHHTTRGRGLTDGMEWGRCG